MVRGTSARGSRAGATIATCALLAACSAATSATPPSPAVTSIRASTTTTTAAATTSVEPSTTNARTTTTTIAPTTTTTTDPPPQPLAVRVPTPGFGEGSWTVTLALDDHPVVWSTYLHPFPTQPAIVASAAVVDQTMLTAALYNGPVIPGLTGWKNGRQVQPAAVPWLVAAFNGGFKLEHNKLGGYVTEGRVVSPMKTGQATLAIDRDGVIHLGVFGTDIIDDGTWKSMFQNLYPVVQDGTVSIDSYHVWWGANDGDVRDVTRSGVCTRRDGRLMYVYATPVDIRPFAESMVAMGCRFGMELDINGIWPQFATYRNFGTMRPRQGQTLDTRMRVPNRYLHWSEKSFIALFDRAHLPAGAVS